MTKLFSVVLLSFLLYGCGDVQFAGASVGNISGEENNDPGNDDVVVNPVDPNPENPVPVDPEEPMDPVNPITPFASLNWYWKCGTESPPLPAVNEKVVTDQSGLTEAEYEKLLGTKMVFSGQICPPAAIKRDVVFVIDVSGSMDNFSTVGNSSARVGNDLFINGTCGRYEAIKTIAAQAQQEDIRFGIITFADVIKKTSPGMYANLEQLEASLGMPLVNAACAGLGGTNFTAAMRAAESMFNNHSRPEALAKDIFFVSDGDPQPASSNGIAEATSMKNKGVRIATALLQGNSTTNPALLRDSIASKDETGAPIHATVANASQLASSLAALAVNKIVSARMKFQPIGGTTGWTDVDLFPHLTGNMFKYEAFKVSLATAPNGIEAIFTYSDKYGNIVENQGELKWTLGP